MRKKKQRLPSAIILLVPAVFFLAQFFAPLAQLDRASDYESEGREFESLRARHLPECAKILARAELLFPSLTVTNDTLLCARKFWVGGFKVVSG